MPPCFGVSSALAGIASARTKSAARPPRKRSCTISSSRSRRLIVAGPLIVEPDPCQILIDEMGRGDFETLHIGPIRHDPMPPQRPDLMRLFVEHVGLEAAHQGALFG